MTTQPRLRLAVIGTGHLGKQHARIFAGLDNVELVGVCDSQQATADGIAREWSTTPFTDYRKLPEVDAVSIAVPTTLHFEVASHFIERGVHVLVEKPMTKTLDEADRLLALAEKHNIKLQVGHIERFNPALMAAMPHIKNPKFIESYRISPFSFRSSDIGVVLDLMIHDLDIILFLVNSPVRRVDAIGIPVLGSKEDVANARIEFDNGCVANLTASRVALKSERTIRGFFDNSYISLHYDKKHGVIYRKNEEFANGKINIHDINPSKITNIQTYAFDKFIDVQEIAMDQFEPLAREMECFVDCILEDSNPVVDGRHGRAAMAAAMEVVRLIDQRLANELKQS
ncbi:Gfo/Idh/MocA family oxidoreductase [Planctomycetota bacterium]